MFPGTVLISGFAITFLFAAAGYCLATRRGRNQSTAVLWAGIFTLFPPVIPFFTILAGKREGGVKTISNLLIVISANIISAFSILGFVVLISMSVDYIKNLDPLDCNSIIAQAYVVQQADAYLGIAARKVADISGFRQVSRYENHAVCEMDARTNDGKKIVVQYDLTSEKNSHFPKVSARVKEQ